MFLSFFGQHPWHMEVPKLGVEMELHLPPTPQPQQRRIWAASVTYTMAHGNTGSLTHWARPGVEPTSLWILVRFVTAEPWWELPRSYCTDFLFGKMKRVLEVDGDDGLPTLWKCLLSMNCALKNGKKKGGGSKFRVIYILQQWKNKFCFAFGFFDCTCSLWEFPGQGSHPSCTCCLCHSFSNAGSLTHCTTGEFPKTVLKNLNGCRIEKELQRLQETGSKVLAAVQDRDGDG